MGALFLSHVRLFDNLTIDEASAVDGGDDIGDRVIMNTLEDYFDEDELRMIEAAFEGKVLIQTAAMDRIDRDAEYNEEEYRDTNWWAVRWVEKYPNPTKRLRAILKNLIANKGRFNITDLKLVKPAKPAKRKEKRAA